MKFAFFTKGYLTGGLYGSTPEEWDALYRLEGARRRWRAARARHQYANTASFGVEPYVVTYRHASPNPVYVQWRAAEAAWETAWAEDRQRQREAMAARLAEKAVEWRKVRAKKAAHWRKMGWVSFRDRARWMVTRLVAGDTQTAIAKKAKLQRSRVSQIIAAERRRRRYYRGPRGRVFEPDNFYPRDAWITYTLEDDPNELTTAGNDLHLRS